MFAKFVIATFLLFFPFFFFFNKCFSFVEKTMKFNQGMYAKIRVKKNEPISSLRKRAVRMVVKGVSVTPLALSLSHQG